MTEPEERPINTGINVDAMGISSYHPGGVNIALADRSTRFFSNTIDSEELRKMLTRK